MKHIVLFLILMTVTIVPTLSAQEWSHYGGDAAGTRYSGLKQITAENVNQLRIVWEFHTGALNPTSELNKKAAFEATPILADGLLYLSSPYNQVFALHPGKGTEIWRYDPQINRSKSSSEVTSRGVSFWRNPAKQDAACNTRIFLGTLDARLIALDAKTGKPCADFGSQGQVDLTKDVNLRSTADYQVTSPPVIVKNLVIVGSSIGDNRAVDLERGIVRAYDVISGAQRWSWDPAPWSRKTTPPTGGANAWGVFSTDEAADLVFVPTSSASPDYYGGLRPGDNRFADSMVALQASTGDLVWGFQVVHHDLWDYDVAAQPLLIPWKGKKAVVVNTKMGNVFVLDSLTGTPIYKVEERKVAQSDVPGELTHPTQPFPNFPPLVKQSISLDDAWGKNAEDLEWCKKQFSKYRLGPIFTPPSIQGTVVVPANIGGVNWGSAAATPEGIMVVNTNHLPLLVRLIPQESLDQEREIVKKENRIYGEFGRQKGAPYAMYREDVISPGGLPCITPPWGTVTAVNLHDAKILWQTPLGTLIPDQQTGSPNLGGPIVTASGLIFTGAAMDEFLRGFDLKSGKEIWKHRLPASPQATPMTYEFEGKQYLVIAAGGHGKMGTMQGDSVVAFALP